MWYVCVCVCVCVCGGGCVCAGGVGARADAPLAGMWQACSVATIRGGPCLVHGVLRNVLDDGLVLVPCESNRGLKRKGVSLDALCFHDVSSSDAANALDTYRGSVSGVARTSTCAWPRFPRPRLVRR